MGREDSECRPVLQPPWTLPMRLQVAGASITGLTTAGVLA